MKILGIDDQVEIYFGPKDTPERPDCILLTVDQALEMIRKIADAIEIARATPSKDK